MKDALTGFMSSPELMLNADKVCVRSLTETVTNTAVLPVKVKLPESHPDYPSITQSQCGNWRVIRCPDDLQWIVQHYRSPKWRNKSYHREWWSLEQRYANFKKPEVTKAIE